MNQNLLRQQVVNEVKKKRLIFFTFILLSFLYLSINLLFGEMGFLRYIELNKTRKNLEKQLVELNRQNSEIRTQIKMLKEDPFYREKLAREEFGLARPGEYIFKYDR